VSDSIKMSANHIQVGGDHYKMQTMQHWDVVAMFDLDYFQGQITKYVFRWKKKGGLQDLKKALHFTQKYIELVEAGTITDPMRSKAVHDAILRDSIPIPTTPPFAGPGTLYQPDGYGMQQPSPSGDRTADSIYRKMYDTQVGLDEQLKRDRIGQQDSASLGPHLQRVQTDGPAMGVPSRGCDNRYDVPEQRSGRESTGPAEQRRYPQNDTPSNPSTRY
jgi:hypothetical protein